MISTNINYLSRGQSNEVIARNYVDAAGNPSGGYAHGPGMCVSFQDGPRGRDAGGELLPANGAFVEDLLVAARQRLAFFQESKFAHDSNDECIRHLDYCIDALHARAKERASRGVLGANVV